ncbi:MAG: phosphotyrosine protein phosphatase [Bdellovibrio sp. CG12_big_fil_rev_8_21_14_0_65_39_13]|nr:MAG: phosphotyrosine protein phosphatase [Bdellovibrio sp. CG22_combo_CG10-13_8_21_14_all_39_27]PIQ59799.1 MAG: phosphotyrosine protein phosphatase [Bdellovibrio sp. CG12_big_fil_rev_8_21_14_0_65_39_13]PIR36173.1 MAG: phosphotyrosine protein phosphatase [Bdellovibrio sp. CG11_big_fil_rev_8_21_14_0_20_39_38]
MMKQKHKILFVCLGNICRSPTAHGVFDAYIRRLNLQKELEIDSAGTSAHHQGQLPDDRSRKHASLRGYQLDSKSRQIKLSDLEFFDEIFVMDDENLKNVMALDHEKKFIKKVKKLTDLIPQSPIDRVPDPYYSGDQGFEMVLDIIEEAAEIFFSQWEKKR